MENSAPSQVPDGCRVIVLSPLEIHFSQTRIRAEFQDGRVVDDALVELSAALSTPGGASSSSSPSPINVGQAVLKGEVESLREAFRDAGLSPLRPKQNEDKDCQSGQSRPPVMLQFPFPHLEVTRWKCKLRERDGTAKVDPKTGLDLYSQEERWFSFDNRRLYCLQRAAAALWPLEVKCEVIEVPGTLARMRELRKFDTRTFGCSVLVGRRDDPDPSPWSWRLSVGLPEEEQPAEGVAKPPSLRWRGARHGSQQGHPLRRRQARTQSPEEEDESEEPAKTGSECLSNTLLFIMVYLILRVVLSICRRHFKLESQQT